MIKNRTGFYDHAQENPDLEEQPERAPEGMDDPPLFIRKLEEDMVFLTFKLSHFLHLIVSAEDKDTSASKCSLQSLQTYS